MENLQEKTFDILEKTGLNWSVNKEPLFTIDKRSTESFGIFRNDTGDWLGTVGAKYEMFQNALMAETVLQAAQGLNLPVTQGGQLFNGKKVFLQAEMTPEMIGNSQVKRWLTCLNSHNGSTSIGFGSANTTVICENTFYRALGEVEKVRHTINAKQRIDTMINRMRDSMKLDQKLMDSFKRMADMPMVEELFAKVTSRIFIVNPKATKAEMSTRKNNQMAKFGEAVEQSVREQGSTIWALFNGITRYTNHIAAPTNPEKKQDFIMASGGATFANIGFNEIMKYIERNTAEYVTV